METGPERALPDPRIRFPHDTAAEYEDSSTAAKFGQLQ